MITRRRVLLAVGSAATITSLGSFAQQTAKTYRVGILAAENASDYVARLAALRAGLRDYGYVEGKNLVVDFRWGEGKYERLPALAAELVRMSPDVLVTFANQAARAAKQTTTTIPIVVPATGDAVDTGLVADLSRPGGNVTGSTFFGRQLVTKRLEILREALPRATRVAVLLNPNHAASAPDLRALQAAGPLVKLDVQAYDVSARKDLDDAFAMMAKTRTDAFIIPEQPIFIVSTKTIASLAASQRMASIGFNEFADDGGLIGYGADLLSLYRRAAYFVDKIFRGTKPADLPIEQATKFELVLNLKTAKSIGITIPQSILLRADKVIE